MIFINTHLIKLELILIILKIIIDILNKKLYLEYNKDEIKEYIIDEYNKKLNTNKFISGFIISPIYNYNKHSKHNIKIEILKTINIITELRDYLEKEGETFITDNLIKQD